MNQDGVEIVIPVFNQLSYTTQCLESLRKTGVADEKIIVINNASTDSTAEFLALHPRVRAFNNETNVGCGPAWTQGAKLCRSKWIVILNNDVVIPPRFFENLYAFATEGAWDIVSPAMREGEMDYDLTAYADEFMRAMSGVRRSGVAHGVCFMVHQRVFDRIGYFSNFGGYEDDDFFRRARKAGYRIATTGRAFLHHFGSITQKSIKEWADRQEAIARRERYRKSTGQTWLPRKAMQLRDRLKGLWWRQNESRRYGRTLFETRLDGRSLWR